MAHSISIGIPQFSSTIHVSFTSSLSFSSGKLIEFCLCSSSIVSVFIPPPSTKLNLRSNFFVPIVLSTNLFCILLNTNRSAVTDPSTTVSPRPYDESTTHSSLSELSGFALNDTPAADASTISITTSANPPPELALSSFVVV